MYYSLLYMAKFSTNTRGMKKTYYDKTNRSKEETKKRHTHIYIYINFALKKGGEEKGSERRKRLKDL